MAGGDAQITDLKADDHACLTYGEPEELHDLTAAFVRDGLLSGLKVVWLSDSELADPVSELARRGLAIESAIDVGQLAAAGTVDRLLSHHSFAVGHAMDWLTGEMTASRLDGYPGLRVALDMSWALRPISGIEQLPEFEESIAAALAGTTVSVLCQYDRERFDSVTLASVAAFHTRSVAAATYHADAMLRICRQYAPPGIRIAGEIDYRAEEPLALALAEAIRFDGDVTVNMSELRFIDASCTRLIVDASRSVAQTRKVILRCPSWIAGRFALYGAAEVPGISLVRADER
jgi:anti-anti-sigma regulatory factor